jgi:hypothetical protein
VQGAELNATVGRAPPEELERSTRPARGPAGPASRGSVCPSRHTVHLQDPPRVSGRHGRVHDGMEGIASPRMICQLFGTSWCVGLWRLC